MKRITNQNTITLDNIDGRIYESCVYYKTKSGEIMKLLSIGTYFAFCSMFKTKQAVHIAESYKESIGFAMEDNEVFICSPSEFKEIINEKNN